MSKPTARQCLPRLFGALLALCLAPSLVEAQRAPALDHLKCYRTTGEPPDVTVLLRDQFDIPGVASDNAFVRWPVKFCNPVEKTTLDGAVTQITDKDAHLEMFITAPGRLEPPRKLLVWNQFGSGRRKELRLSMAPRRILPLPLSRRVMRGPSGTQRTSPARCRSKRCSELQCHSTRAFTLREARRAKPALRNCFAIYSRRASSGNPTVMGIHEYRIPIPFAACRRSTVRCSTRSSGSKTSSAASSTPRRTILSCSKTGKS